MIAVLARLGVQQKLSLLLTLPLIAVIVISVPFTASRVNDALSASSTVGVAQRARAVATLIQDLQEERLLTLTYLVAPEAGREDLRLAIATTAERAEQVASTLHSPADDELRSALGDLRRLDPIRSAALRRSGTPVEVDQTYHALVMGLVTALGLTRQTRVDATGIRQLGTLDALLRINEDITRIGAALVIGTVDASAASSLVVSTLLLAESDIEHFNQAADRDETALLGLVVQGQTAQRINEYARQITVGGLWVSATRALTAAESTLVLTRILQERIAREIAERAADRASSARTDTGVVVGFAILLILSVILLGAAVSRSVARPLRRLTVAASTIADLARTELFRVADSEGAEAGPPKLSAIGVTTTDEIGELAAAFNRVQATAALLMEQQVATRRNTAVMFANVARRTRSMVSRQLTFIDDLERGEQDEQVLTKLYRLDHLTTRLHRSADSLLVVSGVREEERIVSPAPLIDVLRSAIAEIEGYQAVEVGVVCQVTVLPELVPDLRLVLAEVLENATSFSPPGACVAVEATFDRDVRILIVDHGIGMSEERLAEENHRLVERERLDVVPTSVLGLFVVGRLARRHGMRVELRPSLGQGVTVEIGVPAELFTTRLRVEQRPVSGTIVDPNTQPMLELPRYPDPQVLRGLPQLPALPMVEGSFEWFADQEASGVGPALGGRPAQHAIAAQPAAAPPVAAQPAASAVSAMAPVAPRTQPSMFEPVVRAPVVSQPVVPAVSAPPIPTQRSVVEAAGSGGTTASVGQAPDGLIRRTPGGQLRYFGLDVPDHRVEAARASATDLARASAAEAVRVRDAEAERAAMEEYARGGAGLAPAGTAQAGTAPMVAPPPEYPLASEYLRPADPPTVLSAPEAGGSPPSVYPPPPGDLPGQRWDSSQPPAPYQAPGAVPVSSSRERGGLTRRVPGAQLTAGLRSGTARPMAARPQPQVRDADAERVAMLSFLDGFARAASEVADTTVQPDQPE